MKLVILIATGALAMQAASTEGWFLAGSQPQDYDCAPDPSTVYAEQPSAYLKSKEGLPSGGFGTLMRQFDAKDYLGKRIRFSANVKAEDVQGWSGLWMRIDDHSGKDSRTVAFDNMHSRPIRGTLKWKRYSIVLHVPKQATGIFLGILLNGPGAVWINDAEFEAGDSPAAAFKFDSIRVLTGNGRTDSSVTKVDNDIYRIHLPAATRWGASIPNPDKREVLIFNALGRVCWDPHPEVPNGCNGPEGSGAIPINGMAQPEDFLAPDKPAGSIVSKWENGRTYFSVNDRSGAFDDNTGYFNFDVKLAPAER